MKNKYLNYIFILVFLLILTNSLFSQSFYNSKGLGERIYFTNARSMGMGGTIIASPDFYQINKLNPATLVYIPVSRLNGDFIHESLWMQTDDESGYAKYSNLNGISLAIPLKQRMLVSAAGIQPTNQFDYYFDSPGIIDDYNYTKVIKAEGGLNKVFFGFGYAPHKSISIGAYFNHYFGKMTKTWMIDYTSDLFWDTSDKLTRKMWGNNFTAGLLATPVKSLSVGAFYSSEYKLTFQDRTSNTTIKGGLNYVVDADISEKLKMTIPEMWGIGLSYVIKSKYRVSSDFIYEPMSKLKSDSELQNEYNDRKRFGAGLELLPSNELVASYFKKMSYRLGYYHQDLDYVDAGGNSVSEYGVSFGVGFPYYMNIGRIDLAFRFGKRGDLSNNPISEDIFQMFISITGGEKWFVRRRPN